MAGVGGPENFLAYQGFTGYGPGVGQMAGTACPANPSNPGNANGGTAWGAVSNRRIHAYDQHNVDWNPGDPTWGGGQGDNIIGAVNYMSSVGMNGLYLMPMNLGGDGRDVHPFSDPGTDACTPTPASTVFHYSVGRMYEWDIVFSHAQARGILLNFVLAEREQPNIDWLGGSSVVGGVAMSDERKLYLKNMVAMFGHNPGVKWNLCEENRAQASGAAKGQFTATELREMASGSPSGTSMTTRSPCTQTPTT